MGWVPPWEKPAPPKANGAKPIGGAQHGGNGAAAPQAAGSSGGSHSGKPSANGAGKSYKRVRAALQGSGYRIAASFNYCLPDGTVLFTEDRYELFDPHRNSGLAHKEYRFRHTVGGTEYSDTGPRRIIYNWPAIMKAGPGATVYVVEGPYKADTLIRAGLLATAAPYHQWVPECVEALAGRHLIYLADHDHNDAKGRNAGREHAERARKALAATAASFRVVPALLLWQSLGRNGEPPHGWDVRDWIEAGPTVALSQICAAVSGENGLMLIKASSVTAKAVRWLWWRAAGSSCSPACPGSANRRSKFGTWRAPQPEKIGRTARLDASRATSSC
jgi:hypothetical protein